MKKNLGEVVREMRAELGVSMRDLSRRTGMTTAYLSQIETGVRRDPGFGTALKIANGLGVSMDELARRLGGAAGQLPSTAARSMAAAGELRKTRDRIATTLRHLDAALARFEDPPVSRPQKRA